MKRLFIYSHRSLFSEGIQALLSGYPNLNVIGWEYDLEQAIRKIKDSQPDTILLISTGGESPSWTVGQRLLQEGIKSAIMELDLQDNQVCIYRGEMQKVDEVEDLARMVERFLDVHPSTTLLENEEKPG